MESSAGARAGDACTELIVTCTLFIRIEAPLAKASEAAQLGRLNLKS